MIKIKPFVYIAILMMALTGCGKAEQEQLTVYSFSGENEQLAVTNGMIILNGTEEIFDGGDLKVTGDFPSDITSYSTTFYTMSGSEKDIILSNSMADMMGSMVKISGDLGQISGDSAIRSNVNGLGNNLYFGLITKNKNGEENVYQLQMSLTETENAVGGIDETRKK